MRRAVRAAAVVLGTAGLAVPAQAPAVLISPPVPAFPAGSLVPAIPGPHCTRCNHGYEGADELSPVLPPSYAARIRPRRLGIQFVGDDPHRLRRDGLALSLTGPGWRGRLPLRFGPAGFGGGAVPPAGSGRWQLHLVAPGFPATGGWTVTVRPCSGPPAAGPGRWLPALNALRRVLGEDPAAWSAPLARAAAAHAAYLARNGYDRPSFHLEDAGRPGFTGRDPALRDLAWGFRSPLVGEEGAEWRTPRPGPVVVLTLVNTVSHRLGLLSPNLLAAGAAQAGGPHGAAVMDLGYGYRDDLPPAVVYPFPGQNGVPVAWEDREEPDPVPHGFGRRFGYPLTVDFPTAAAVQLVAVRLQPAGSGARPLPLITDAPGRRGLGPNQVGLVPMAPLWPFTVYQATLRARVRFNDGRSRAVTVRWRFATGGGAEAVAAAPARHGIWVAVGPAGGERPAPGVAVEVRQTPGGRVLGRGRTGAAGMAFIPLRRPPAGGERLMVLTRGGNGALVDWGGE
ncbi:CAP domain-containing protein [Candidatus Hydrogenisulfobacillus filiaventi]|uniref:CAP domain-containing protein n=1 Tax=Candidatus Hydrogenisulfobacillus filiaventi TaxID=2707344 RepID=A0A6F8ZJ30_9FIRM|nr:CAP domain-containing protein [Candidatus Hydrogenisulfobacillus filiaventi]